MNKKESVQDYKKNGLIYVPQVTNLKEISVLLENGYKIDEIFLCGVTEYMVDPEKAIDFLFRNLIISDCFYSYDKEEKRIAEKYENVVKKNLERKSKKYKEFIKHSKQNKAKVILSEYDSDRHNALILEDSVDSWDIYKSPKNLSKWIKEKQKITNRVDSKYKWNLLAYNSCEEFPGFYSSSIKTFTDQCMRMGYLGMKELIKEF